MLLLIIAFAAGAFLSKPLYILLKKLYELCVSKSEKT